MAHSSCSLRLGLAVVAATLCLVVLAHDGVAAAARPLATRHTAAAGEGEKKEEAAMDVSTAAAAESPEGARWGGGGEALGSGKWLPLPMANGLRFPPTVLPGAGAGAGVSMPWMAGAPPALAGPGLPLVPTALAGPGLPLMPPYVGATRQEQLSLWASLFNPFQVRPRLPAAGMTSSGPAEFPAIAGVGPERTSAVDEPAVGVQVGDPKWGVFLANNNGGN